MKYSFDNVQSFNIKSTYIVNTAMIELITVLYLNLKFLRKIEKINNNKQNKLVNIPTSSMISEKLISNITNDVKL